MSEEKLLKLEASNKDVVVAEKFKGPVGEVATEFLDKLFTQLEEYIDLKLKDGWYKTIAITQIEVLYAVLRAFVLKTLP